MKGILVFVILSSLVVVQNIFATTFANRPLGDIMRETAIVVRGKAGDSYSEWDKSGRKQIFTYTYFTVSEVMKGHLNEEKIVLRQPGGGKDGIEMNVPGTANFRTDEEVVVMLGEKNQDDDSYDVPGFATGKYNVTQGPNGEPMLENSLGGGAIYNPNKDPRTMSYNSKIPLEVFRRVAKGEDIPEAEHRQYKDSKDNAPAHAYDSDHHKHVAQAPEIVATPTLAPNETITQGEAPKSKSIWIPVSFSFFAALITYVIWRSLKKTG